MIRPTLFCHTKVSGLLWTLLNISSFQMESPAIKIVATRRRLSRLTAWHATAVWSTLNQQSRYAVAFTEWLSHWKTNKVDRFLSPNSHANYSFWSSIRLFAFLYLVSALFDSLYFRNFYELIYLGKVLFDPDLITADQIVESIGDMGFEARLNSVKGKAPKLISHSIFKSTFRIQKDDIAKNNKSPAKHYYFKGTAYWNVSILSVYLVWILNF